MLANIPRLVTAFYTGKPDSGIAEQRVSEFERDADAGKVLVRIWTARLIWIDDRDRRRIAFDFIRQVMIGDDDVQAVVACPRQGARDIRRPAR